MPLPFIAPAELSTEQRHIYEEMHAGIEKGLQGFKSIAENGALMGPWNPRLHGPPTRSASPHPSTCHSTFCCEGSAARVRGGRQRQCDALGQDQAGNEQHGDANSQRTNRNDDAPPKKIQLGIWESGRVRGLIGLFWSTGELVYPFDYGEVIRDAQHLSVVATPFPNHLLSIRVTSGGRPSIRLDLHGNTEPGRRTRDDHQIAALHIVLSPHDLPDRAKCVDDRGSRRVGRERRQRLEDAAAIRPQREREHVRMLRLEPRHRGLQHLQQPLIE